MVARRKSVEPRVNGAGVARSSKLVHYPERDGKPMGETETHIREIMRLIQTLDSAFERRPDVYVGGDLLVYYEEGNPRRFVVPDVFVAIGAAKLPRRRIWKLWEERIPPTFVIEVTSPSTRRVDLLGKRDLYARLGVRDYVLYDPLNEYLRPSVQGFSLRNGTFVTMPTERDLLVCESVGLLCMLHAGQLRVIDRTSGRLLLSPEERVVEERHARDELQQRLATAEQLLAAEVEARRGIEERFAAQIESLEERLRRLTGE